MEHEFPSGSSNQENGTTFQKFRFLFQWGEPKKRVPSALYRVPNFRNFWLNVKRPKASDAELYSRSNSKQVVCYSNTTRTIIIISESRTCPWYQTPPAIVTQDTFHHKAGQTIIFLYCYHGLSCGHCNKWYGLEMYKNVLISYKLEGKEFGGSQTFFWYRLSIDVYDYISICNRRGRLRLNVPRSPMSQTVKKSNLWPTWTLATE